MSELDDKLVLEKPKVKKKSVSNTQRTLAYLKDSGYMTAMAERWVEAIKCRIDMFGFIDIVAVGHGHILAVQSCAGDKFAEHDRKILGSEKARKWMIDGNAPIMLIGWRKLKKERGKAAQKWEPKIKNYTLEDFNER